MDQLDAILDELQLSTRLRDKLLAGGSELIADIGERLEKTGETVLDLGIGEGGETLTWTEEEWPRIREHLDEAVAANNATAKQLTGKDLRTGCFLLRKTPAAIEDVIETRVAVVGNVDAGKSSMLGVLTTGHLDDGRGSARVNLFRHKHEIDSGRTSSVGMEIMGFDQSGEIVTAPRKLSWQDIGKRSTKVVTFFDLAGHERYLKTTVFGLFSSYPDFCLLMVAANNGLVGMSREHLGIATSLGIPVMVIITEIDICPANILEQTISSLTKILKSPGSRKVPLFIDSPETCVKAAESFFEGRGCPVFQVSNVTGANLDLVRLFLNVVPRRTQFDAERPFEFHVNDIFSVPFVGTVVSGVVSAGKINAGDAVVLGPNALGQFTPTIVRTIERKRLPVSYTSAGQSASFALRKVRADHVRKGMVLLVEPTTVVREFIAQVRILSHSTTIAKNYQGMVHIGPVYQTCAIIDMDCASVRSGEQALVVFRFVSRPEVIRVGDQLLFREGRTKGLGSVKALDGDLDAFKKAGG